MNRGFGNKSFISRFRTTPTSLIVIGTFILISVAFFFLVLSLPTSKAPYDIPNPSIIRGVLSTPPHKDFKKHDPYVCIIARTYTGHKHTIAGFVHSLLASQYANMHIFLLDTENTFKDVHRIASAINLLYDRTVVTVVPSYNVTALYPKMEVPDYGYPLTYTTPHTCACSSIRFHDHDKVRANRLDYAGTAERRQVRLHVNHQLR